MLFNPVCIVFYANASWKFFSERIAFEEVLSSIFSVLKLSIRLKFAFGLLFIQEMLVNFFGAEYTSYRSQVPTGIPHIN